MNIQHCNANNVWPNIFVQLQNRQEFRAACRIYGYDAEGQIKQLFNTLDVSWMTRQDLWKTDAVETPHISWVWCIGVGMFSADQGSRTCFCWLAGLFMTQLMSALHDLMVDLSQLFARQNIGV